MSSIQKSPDVAVVGDGIAGSSVALELARRGLRVSLFGAGRSSRSATWNSGGMLAPKAEMLTGSMLAMGEAALAHYPSFLASLAEEGATAPEPIEGVLVPVYEEDPLDWINSYGEARRTEGRAVELLGRAELPHGIGERGLLGGWRFANESAIDPRGLLTAIHEALIRYNVDHRPDEPVLELDPKEGACAITTTVRRLAADRVVVAAGHATTALGGIEWGEPAQYYGDRGLMIRLAAPAPSRTLYRHRQGGLTYVVPDPIGVRLGSTSAPRNPATDCRAGELSTLINHGIDLWPALNEAHIVACDVGFRPVGPGSETEPFVGALEPEGRIWGLLGLHRNGILLAPHLAATLAAELLAGNHRKRMLLAEVAPQSIVKTDIGA